MRPDGVEAARSLVQLRFPSARAAWLGGSIAAGASTKTSDLDITVLLNGPPAPFRESTEFEGWPAELFVQTEASLLRFCAQDAEQRRRPTTMRLVGSSIVLVDADGSGRRLRDRLHQLDITGPQPATATELETARYLITDLVTDLGGADHDEALVLATNLWTAAAELVLTANRRWIGSGKWLLRELNTLDAELGTTYSVQLINGLRAAARGDSAPMRVTVEAILELVGGRLFDGYRREGPSDSLTLRNAVDDDLAFSFELRKAAMGEYISAVWGWDESVQRAVHSRDFTPGRLQIICLETRDIGAMDVESRTNERYLDRIDLLPEFQGRGIGTRLIRDLVAQAHANDQPVTLNVLAVNSRAERFYRSLGFVETGRVGSPPDVRITMSALPACQR